MWSAGRRGREVGGAPQREATTDGSREELPHFPPCLLALNAARPALPESRTGLALRRDRRGELRHGTMALRPFVPLTMNGAVMSDIQHCITKLAPLGVVPGTVECRFTSPN